MALAQRISALQKRHEWLDQILAQEMHHPFQDEARVAQIKKSKLRVKDEIVSLKTIQARLAPVFDDTGQHYRRAS